MSKEQKDLSHVDPAVLHRIKLLAKWPETDKIKKSFEMKTKFEAFSTEIAMFMASLDADVGRTLAVMDLLRHAKDESMNAVALGTVIASARST